MTHWSNPEFDAAVKAGAQTTDFEVQKENYGTAIRLQSENDGIVLPRLRAAPARQGREPARGVAELRQLLRFHGCLF